MLMAEKRRERTEQIVLVVDDDLFMRSVVRQTLRRRAGVVEHDSGLEVLKAYEEHAPDVLLLDIHLPGRSGLEWLGEILAFDPDAHIVMLSADPVHDNVARAIDGGAKGFVCKPFKNETLIRHFDRYQKAGPIVETAPITAAEALEMVGEG